MGLDMDKIEAMLSQEVDPVYKSLAEKMQEPDSRHLPHILARLANLQQARILNMIKSTPEDIAKTLGVDVDAVEKDLQVMYERGLLHKGRSGWHLNRSWPAARDAVGASNAKYNDTILFDLISHKEKLDRQSVVDKVKSGEVEKVRQGMRVIPRWASIKDIEGVLPCEDVKEILNAGPVAIVECPCKRIERFRDCKDEVPIETCIVIGKSAQYNLDRGAGRELTVDEALKIIEDLDTHQVVHMTGNSNIMPPLLCNCHSCCCGALMRNTLTKSEVNQFAIVKSRFIAEEDQETCNGCGKCAEDRCPVNAIEIKMHPEYGEERAFTDPEECIGCGLCVITCPTNARNMKLVRLPEHIPAPGARSEEYGTY